MNPEASNRALQRLIVHPRVRRAFPRTSPKRMSRCELACHSMVGGRKVTNRLCHDAPAAGSNKGLQMSETSTSKTPSHIAYHVRDNKSGDAFWTRIGSAWQHADGKDVKKHGPPRMARR